MKPLERVYILVEPADSDILGNGQANPPAREFYEYDRFCQELRQHTSARVEVVESRLSDAPRDGFLLIAFHIAMRAPLLRNLLSTQPNEAQPVLLNTRYEDAFSLAQAGRCSGVVMSDRYIFWKLGQDERTFRQLYGLRSLAPLLDPILASTPLGPDENYCMYESRDLLTLPFALGNYISAYWLSLCA